MDCELISLGWLMIVLGSHLRDLNRFSVFHFHVYGWGQMNTKHYTNKVTTHFSVMQWRCCNKGKNLNSSDDGTLEL